MTDDNKKTSPRFEFRIFGDDFESVVELFYDLFSNTKMTKKISSSNETYIVPQTESNLNIKLRDNFLDIKKLIKKSDSLEQWKPIFKTKLPIDAETLKEKFSTLFETDLPNLEQDKYTKEQFLELLQNDCLVDIVKVYKKRTLHVVDDISFEIAKVSIEQMHLQTICLESTDQDKLQNLLSKLHINDMKNTNYIQEIKQLHQNVLR
jgi:hypothetical protein